MELRQLRYVVAIAEEGSFTRAAERLWIAQPGLSTQIRRLEAELGITLFKRHTRGADLTDAGELFLERARPALTAADAARSTGHDIEAGLVGTVRLGIATETVSDAALRLLHTFGRDHPDVELTVFESYGGTLMRDLRDGRLEALVAPSLWGSAEFSRLRIGRERWLVLAGPAHRLAAARGPVAARELDGEPIVVTAHRDGAAYARAVTELLADLHVTPDLHRAGAWPALLMSVAAGEAVALTTSERAATAGLVARRLDPACGVDFELLWRDETPSAALSQLTAAARAPAAQPALAAVA